MELSAEEQLKLDHARLILEMEATPNWKAFLEKNIAPGLAFLDAKLSGGKKLSPEEYSGYFERREGIKWILGEIAAAHFDSTELEKKQATIPDNSAATGTLA